MNQKSSLLRQAEAGVRSRRREDVADLERLLAWADLHADDPQAQPNAVPVSKGGPRLVQLAGEGTPRVIDVSLCEIAIARDAGTGGTRNATADALDLRHRLPAFWAEVRELQTDVWVARKIARLTRRLAKQQCASVDTTLASAIGEGPHRLLTIAEAEVIKADEVAHAERLAEQQKRQGVWLGARRPGDQVDEDDPNATPGLRSIFARLSEGKAVDLDATIDAVADLLAEHGDYDPENPPSRDQLRADALALLAHPDDVLTLYGSEKPRRAARRPATVFIHLSDAAVAGAGGVARIEQLGPMLVRQLGDLLRRRDITITPVIDLHEGRSVNGYEHPTDVRRRSELRTLGDVFPHSASSPGAKVDQDHPVPYNRDGPPGQTGDHNAAPLTRRHHRAKTHAGYRVAQTGPGRYTWVTPNGLIREVDGAGTRRVDRASFSEGEFYVARLQLEYASA